MRNKKTLILILLLTFFIIPTFNYINADIETETEITQNLANTIQGNQNGFTYMIKDSKAYIISLLSGNFL